MTHFFDLPPPFIGSRQPLVPSELPPSLSAVAVNNPTPDANAAIATENILDAWNAQPDPTQWLQRAALLPQTGSPGATVLMTRLWFDAVRAVWQPDDPSPQQRQLLAPAITAVEVDNPPLENLNALFVPIQAS